MTHNWSSSTVRWTWSGLLPVLAVVFLTAPPALAAQAVRYAKLSPYTAPPPHRHSPNVTLSKGKFLVASGEMNDPRFSETVIILLDYSSHGAVGLVINRPTKLELSRALPDVKWTEQDPGFVYYGGPVNMRRTRVLIRSESQPGDATYVFDDVYVSSSTDLLQRLVDVQDASAGYRVYAGYAGWGPHQLDQEVERGGWRVMDGDADVIFSKKPSNVWSELMQSP